MADPQTDPSGDTTSTESHWRDLRSHAEHIRDLPIRESEFVQIGRGDPGFRSIEARGRDALVLRLRIQPTSSVTKVPASGWLALMMPIEWQGDFRINGQSATPGMIHVLGGVNGFSTLGQKRDVLTVGLRIADLVRAIAALAGIDEEDVRLPEGAVGGGEAGDLLRRRAFGVLHDRGNASGSPGLAPLHPAEKGDLQLAAGRWLLAHAVRRCANVRRRVDPVVLVRMAEDAMRARPGKQLGLIDLCVAAGVGHSQLSAAFSTVHGVSPIRYLRQWRLTLARERLLTSDARASRIKAIALDLGFMHSGRFASAYYTTFGEFPSQTAGRGLLRRHRMRPA